MHKNENTQNLHSFLALAFFRGICLSRHQQIWNQHKILHFLIPILIFSRKKIFWVIIALFAILKCKCEKNCTFSNILQKVKSYFLPISIILRVIPVKFETLKPPREHPPLTHIQSNACRFLFLLFSYLRFAEAASFDKKELCRSDTTFSVAFLLITFRMPLCKYCMSMDSKSALNSAFFYSHIEFL